MYRYLLIPFLSLLLHATEVEIHVPCDSRPYAYCVDNKPIGVATDIIKAIFEKFEDYTLRLLPLNGDDVDVKIIAPVSQNQFTQFDVIETTKPILENNDSTTFYIGFSTSPFFKQKDLTDKINLAIEIMHSRKQIEFIVEQHRKKDEIYKKGKKVEVGLYNWGEKMVSEEIETYGLIPEIITAAFREKNIEVVYNFFDYYGYLYLMTKWGKVCTSASWLNTPDRRDYFYFSNNLFTTIDHLYYRKKFFPNSIQYDNFEDLIHYKIGGISGMHYEKKFKENKLMRYTSYLTHKDAIAGLLKHEVDIIISEPHHFNKAMPSSFPSDIESITLHPKPLFKTGNHLAFSKRCEESEVLREQFNNGFRIIQDNGVLDKILLKYDEKREKINSHL